MSLSDYLFKARSDMFNQGRIVRELHVKAAIKELILELDLPTDKNDVEYAIILKVFGEELL